MNTLLSHSVCQRLRDAGFPQPVLAPGQHWYVHESAGVMTCVVLEDDGDLYFRHLESDDARIWPAPVADFPAPVYIPTADELFDALEVGTTAETTLTNTGECVYLVAHWNETPIMHFGLSTALAETWLDRKTNYKP